MCVFTRHFCACKKKIKPENGIAFNITSAVWQMTLDAWRNRNNRPFVHVTINKRSIRHRRWHAFWVWLSAIHCGRYGHSNCLAMIRHLCLCLCTSMHALSRRNIFDKLMIQQYTVYQANMRVWVINQCNGWEIDIHTGHRSQQSMSSVCLFRTICAQHLHKCWNHIETTALSY